MRSVSQRILRATILPVAVLLSTSSCGKNAPTEPSHTEPPPPQTPTLITWQETDGPRARNIVALAVTSVGTYLANTDGGLFRSTDQGASWTWTMRGCADYPCNFIVAPHGIIWTSLRNQVLRSADDGSTWQRVSTMTSNSILALTRGPDGQLFAGTRAGGVFLSPDEGATWTPVNRGLLSMEVECLAVTPSGFIIAGTEGGFCRSLLDTISWTAINQGTIWGGSPGVHSLLSTPDGILCAGTTGGTARSTDDGDHWTMVSKDIMCCMVHYPSGELVAGYSGLGPAPFGISVSSDMGLTWTRTQGMQSIPISLAVDSLGRTLAGFSGSLFRSSNLWFSWSELLPGPQGALVEDLVATPGGRLFATTYATAIQYQSSLFVSDDDGEHWSRMTLVYGMYLASNATGEMCTMALTGPIYISRDWGATWSGSGPSSPGITNCVAMSSLGDIYCGTRARGVYRLSSNWVQAGLPSESINCLAADDSGAVYAGGDFSGVVRSRDRGLSWTPPGQPQGQITSIVVGPRSDLFACAWGNGPWRSTDRGATWVQRRNGIVAVTRLAIAPGSSGLEVYALGTGGWFRFSYADNQWVQADDGVPLGAGTMTCLAGRNDGAIFVGTSVAGVFKGLRP